MYHNVTPMSFEKHCVVGYPSLPLRMAHSSAALIPRIHTYV